MKKIHHKIKHLFLAVVGYMTNYTKFNASVLRTRFLATLGMTMRILEEKRLSQKSFSTQMTQIEQINADFNSVDNQTYIKIIRNLLSVKIHIICVICVLLRQPLPYKSLCVIPNGAQRNEESGALCEHVTKLRTLSYALIVVMVACFSGCQTIDDPYYLVDPVPLDTLSAESFKKVLLEDYTGIRCNNCPAAAKIAEEIAVSSRHRVLVMAVHAGGQSDPRPPFTLDLRCPEGLTYYKDFGLGGTPIGVINRSRTSAGDFGYYAPGWAKTVEAELQQPMTFKLKVEGALTDDGTTINATITYTATGAATTDYNLLVFLVEDGFVGMQQNGAIIDTEYVFHNVLRETLHGDAYYGIPIEKPVAGVENTYTFDNYQIKSIDKKAENSTYKLIVAITQRDSRYVEQVEEIGL